MGIGGSRIGQFGHGRPSDEETLRVRVDRIEGKPLGCHQFGILGMVCFKLNEEDAVERFLDWL